MDHKALSELKKHYKGLDSCALKIFTTTNPNSINLGQFYRLTNQKRLHKFLVLHKNETNLNIRARTKVWKTNN